MLLILFLLTVRHYALEKEDEFVEFVIPNLVHDSLLDHHRNKRDALFSEDDITVSNQMLPARRLVFNIKAFGLEFTLLLYEDVDDLPSSIVVQYLRQNSTTESVLNVSTTTCLFRGSLVSESTSDVLISLCPSMVSNIANG